MYNVQSDVSIERRLQDATDEIESVTITEGSPFVLYLLKDKCTQIAVNVDELMVYRKIKDIITTEDCKNQPNNIWVKRAQVDIYRGNSEIYRN